MNIKKLLGTVLIGTVLIGTVLTVHAETKFEDNKGWIDAGSTSTHQFFIKKGSAAIENGIRSMLAVSVPIEESADVEPDYKKFAISEIDCERGYGAMKIYTPAGEFLHKSDYIQGEKSMAASLMDMLCKMDVSK